MICKKSGCSFKSPNSAFSLSTCLVPSWTAPKSTHLQPYSTVCWQGCNPAAWQSKAHLLHDGLPFLFRLPPRTSKQALVLIRVYVCLCWWRGKRKRWMICFHVFWQNHCWVKEETWGETAEGTAAEGQTPGGKDAQTAEAHGEGKNAKLTESTLKKLHAREAQPGS